MRRLSFYILLIMGVTLWSLSSVMSFVYQVKAGGDVMEICTAEGFVTITVSDNEGGKEGKEKPSCPFCAVASTSGVATLSGLQASQISLYHVRRDSYAPVYEFVLSRAFKSGLNTPLRAPPVYS